MATCVVVASSWLVGDVTTGGRGRGRGGREVDDVRRARVVSCLPASVNDSNRPELLSSPCPLPRPPHTTACFVHGNTERKLRVLSAARARACSHDPSRAPAGCRCWDRRRAGAAVHAQLSMVHAHLGSDRTTKPPCMHACCHSLGYLLPLTSCLVVC
jgi:hypothetical protein